MNPDRIVWGDSRIQAEFARVEAELHDLRPLPERVDTLLNEVRGLRDLPKHLAEFSVEFRNLRQDVSHCFDAIRTAEDKREKREEEQRIERKSDRRWIFGSAMTAAGLVIAALGVLAGGFH